MDAITLNREIYVAREAADILRISVSTLRWWLEGGTRRGQMYQPLLRSEPTGSDILTWGEFVEAGLLKEFQKNLMTLRELRSFMGKLREKHKVAYPVAHRNTWIGKGRQLMLKLQKETALPGEWWLVSVADNQVVLTELGASFLKHVEWEKGLAASWRPHNDHKSPVRCFPTRRFGRPSIKGISTQAIVEHLYGGEDDENVAEQFGITVADVGWARAYDLSHRAHTTA